MSKNVIPYGKQSIDQDDINAVVEVLQADYLTQVPKINEFEKAFANYVGSKYAIAVSNGTAALHLSVLALDLQPGDKVITTPITFAASANCIRYCGGDVVFADIDPETYLLDINAVKKLLEAAPKGTYKGIIPVDFAGRPVDLEAFRKLADEYDLWLLEDACHAPGGYLTDSQNKQQNCGNGNFADLAIFSFHPVKHIACGEGGMVTTNSKALYDKVSQLRTHGITKDADAYENSIEFAGGTTEYPAWYMEMQTLGYNYRLTDFQAALGISQLQKAHGGIKKRREIAQRYFDAFHKQPFIQGQSGVVEGHAYHLYVIQVDDRLGLYNHLRAHNIFAQIHYIPCHLMPYYKKQGWNEGDLPQAEAYYKSCLSLPMFPTLTQTDLTRVIDTIIRYYER